ncbi:MAG: hypothetical protein ACR2N3_15440 [Pyrinomonadaceae bacterium]
MNIKGLYLYVAQIIGAFKQMFMQHPRLYHYGENWRVPKSGKDYQLHIQWFSKAF